MKQLNIYGFKSFADKTEIDFVPGVTAVVGPNGSGKSNVTDALRWVLGEQSAKSLRGAVMEDIIFAGSDARKQLNYAEVSITLDNSSGTLPIDFKEVSVKRRAYRSGESEFFINKSPCRLKDIVELFTDSGLGRESFTIIGQGKIDQVLNSKPEDRRAIFEEAAGVLKYKQRKRKTEQKLLESEENLIRVRDILGELESRRESLQKQAETAKAYLQKKKELETCEIMLTVQEIDSLEKQWITMNAEYEKATDEDIRLQTDIQKLDFSLQDNRKEQEKKDELVDELQGNLLSSSEQLEKCEGSRQVLREKKKSAEENRTHHLKRADKSTSLLDDLQAERTALISEISGKQEGVRNLLDAMGKCTNEIENLQAESHNNLERLKSDYVQKMHKQTSDKNQLEFVKKQCAQIEAQREKAAISRLQQLEEKEAFKKKLSFSLLKQQEDDDSRKQTERSIRELHDQLKGLRNQMEELKSRRYELAGKHQSVLAEKRSLEAIADDFGGYAHGVREVLKARNGVLPGIRGTVAELITVPLKLERAIETSLGGSVQHIIVESANHAREAIEFLKRDRRGRATFLPLDTIRPKFIPEAQRRALKQSASFIGIASELVDFHDVYRPAINSILGNVIIAKDLKGAGELAHALDFRYRIVTLEGDVISPGGSMAGGQSKQQKSSFISRKNRIESLKKQQAHLVRDMSVCDEKVNGLLLEVEIKEKELNILMKREDVLKNRLNALIPDIAQFKMSIENIERSVGILDSEEADWTRRDHELRMEEKETEAKMQDREKEMVRLEEEIERITKLEKEQQEEKERLIAAQNEMRIKEVSLREQEAAVRDRFKRVEEQIEDAASDLHDSSEKADFLKRESNRLADEEEKLASEILHLQEEKTDTLARISAVRAQRLELQEAASSSEAELNELRRQHRKAAALVKEKEMKLHGLELEAQNIFRKFNESFSIPLQRARQEFIMDEDPAEKKALRNRLKNELKSLGTVNIGAIDEYEEVNRRCSFLSEQQADLLTAKDTLFRIIDEMDEEMTKRFGNVFHQIQQAFSGVFSSLFGGGKAELRLTDPDELLTTGIDIIVQPPGKKLQNLQLLSGGERSLAAIALLFSILKVRPVPFCVLDEVEAALDEANVHRFSQYLRNFSGQTQFIVITHRQGTMEGADVLYGITMQESGVSKLVSVKLEDSHALAQT